jgi:hypothetical protein
MAQAGVAAGTQAPLPIVTTSLSQSPSCAFTRKPIKKAGIVGRNRSAGVQARIRNSLRWRSRLLLPHVHRSKEVRKVQASDRSQIIKSACDLHSFQDGVRSDSAQTTSGGRLGGVHRPLRRLFTSSHSPGLKKVPALLYSGQDQFRALCFGLNVAPKVFTKMLQPVAQYLRLRGIRVHRYLDDWLITASSPEMALQHTQETIDLLSTLGWLVNKDKSELVPSQNIVFLGMGIDFASGLVRPSQETLNKISAWSVILHSVCVLSVKDFLSLLGLLNHACKFIDLGRLHLRPLQFYLKCKQADLRELYAYVSLDPIFFVAWSWWENTTRLMAGVPFQGPVPQVTLFTDASLQGWGATVLSHSAKGLWSKAERRLHITVLELRAVRLGLQALLHLVSDRCVHIMSDNVATVAYIRNEGGTHSISLYREVRDLLTWCRQHGIRLVPAFIPGCRNVGADSLSRQRKVLSTEWSLQKAVFRRLLQAVPDIEVDLFATRWNHQMPRFVSPFPDTLAWRVDALSFPWDGLTAYAYPPQVLIPEVLNRVINSSVLLYLVAPLWRAQTWYPTLLHLLVDLPLQLRPNRLLVQPQSQIYHSRPKFLNLHVFPLSSDEYKRQAFLQRLQSLHLDPYGSHQYASTNLTIGNSVAGVIHGISVPTMRL